MSRPSASLSPGAGLEELKLAPALWAALDPARHGIDHDEQEAIFQRVRAQLRPRQQDTLARWMGGDLWERVDRTRPAFQHLFAQYEYATMAHVAENLLTREEHRTLTQPWRVVTSRLLLDDDDQPGMLSPRAAGLLADRSRRREGIPAVRETFAWGTLYAQVSRDGQITHQISTRKSTPTLHFLATPAPFQSGEALPCAPVWALWMLAVLVAFMAAPGLGLWLLPLGAAGALATIGAVSYRLRHDLHPVEDGTPTARLVQLAVHDRDAGLLAQLRAAGWSWERLDSWSLVECIELAAHGRDGGLVRELIAAGWPLDAEAAPELVEVAGRALNAAAEVAVAEVSVEVPGLVLFCESDEDMHAACAALASLCRDLDDLSAAQRAHHAQVEAPVLDAIDADARTQRVLAAEAAQARAVASLESSRRAVRLTTDAHHALTVDQPTL